jgi:hypothetical protein
MSQSAARPITVSGFASGKVVSMPSPATRSSPSSPTPSAAGALSVLVVSLLTRTVY